MAWLKTIIYTNLPWQSSAALKLNPTQIEPLITGQNATVILKD